MKNFWRLPVLNEAAAEKILAGEQLKAPPELYHKIKPGHGIVLARWESGQQVGLVVALGVVVKVNVSGSTAEISWRRANITLKPNPSGRQFWLNKPFFRFADAVAVRYMLDDLFAEHFPDLCEIELEKVSGVVRPATESYYQVIPGYVYLIKSQYGYKIGKTVNIKSRTNLFTVKLPFPIELVNYAWFDNYSKAERELHSTYAAKRLEGEWFDLSGTEVDQIKRLGKPMPVAGL